MGLQVLLDDRKERPGVKFSDMELLGIPHRLVISDRGLEDGTFEYKHRRANDKVHIKADELVQFLQENCQRD